MTNKEQQARTTESDMQGIDRVRQAHIAALNSGDAEAWTALFSEDAVQMPPNQPANGGREAIRRWNQSFLSSFRASFGLAVEEVRLANDWAFERGTYTIALAPRPGGASLQDIGKYITIYQRQPHGNWEVARDIWNSNNPLP